MHFPGAWFPCTRSGRDPRKPELRNRTANLPCSPLDAFGFYRFADCLHYLFKRRSLSVKQVLQAIKGAGVTFANLRISHEECFILRKRETVTGAKALRLVCSVIFRANEITHFRIGKQTVDIIIMSHEFDRVAALFLLPAKLGGYGLEFFDEGLSRMVTRNIDRPVILDLNLFCHRVVIYPG